LFTGKNFDFFMKILEQNVGRSSGLTEAKQQPTGRIELLHTTIKMHYDKSRCLRLIENDNYELV
jgi:hypothetical protein